MEISSIAHFLAEEYNAIIKPKRKIHFLQTKVIKNYGEET